MIQLIAAGLGRADGDGANASVDDDREVDVPVRGLAS